VKSKPKQLRQKRPKKRLGPVNNILVLRHGALGDVVVEVPGLEAIRARFPNAHITLLCDPYSGPILEGLPYFDETIVAHEKLGTRLAYFWQLLQLRRRKFDLVIAMRGTGRSRIQALLIGGRTRHGYVSSRLGTSMFTQTGSTRPGEHRVMNMLHYLGPLGITTGAKKPKLKIALESSVRRQAKKLLDAHGVTRKFVVIHPTFSVRPPNETWSDSNWATVSDKLFDEGFDIVMSSGAAQGPIVSRILEGCHGKVAKLSGKTSPRVLAAILEIAEIYIGYNTGAMHVSAAVGTPIVAVFEQPSKYHEWYPWTEAPFKILIPENAYEGSDEIPLYIADSITPESVVNAVFEVLAMQDKVRKGSTG
jgi:ADP-heptose:LPS heptosyltransferase